MAADEPDGRAPQIARGVRIDGDDLGAWVARQQEPRVWARLSAEQRARLEALGLRPAETAPGRGVEGTGAAGSGKPDGGGASGLPARPCGARAAGGAGGCGETRTPQTCRDRQRRRRGRRRTPRRMDLEHQEPPRHAERG
nr:helicase associated domain-containing protein [Streptomyces sp. SID8380]